VRVVIGVIGMALLSRFKYHNLKYFGLPLLILAMGMLLCMKIPGLGENFKGATRSLSIFGQSFQPAEIAKFALIIYMADSVTRRGEDLTTWVGYINRSLIIIAMGALIIWQPSFSVGLLLCVLGWFILFLGGAKIGYFLVTGLVGIPITIKVALMENYRLHRLLDYLEGLLHPEKLLHQANQSLIALGDGGFLGVGIGKSQQKAFFLPEPHTDYIFSILGEELGFIGAIVVLIIFIIIAVHGIKIAKRAPDKFGFVLAGAITFAIISYALINLMVVTGILPVTGLPLPFLTYGGSSLVVNLSLVGILLNISRHSEQTLPSTSSEGQHYVRS
jgi:cell division protein FtsW